MMRRRSLVALTMTLLPFVAACGSGDPATGTGGSGGSTGGSGGGGGGQGGGLGACSVTYSDVVGSNGYTTSFNGSPVATHELASGRTLFSIYVGPGPGVDSKVEVAYDGALEAGPISDFMMLQRTMTGDHRWEKTGGTMAVDSVSECPDPFCDKRVRFHVTGATLEADATTAATGSFTVDVDCETNVHSG